MHIQPFTLFIPIPPKSWLGSGITSVTQIAIGILSGVIAYKLGNFSWSAAAWVSVGSLVITNLFFEKVYRTMLMHFYLHPIAKEISMKFCDEIIKLFDHAKLPSQAYHDMPIYKKFIFTLLKQRIPNMYDRFGSNGSHDSIGWPGQNSHLSGEIQITSHTPGDIPMICSLQLR